MNSQSYKIPLISIAIILFLGFSLLIMKVVPAGLGIDWRLTYRPAALALLHGQNPYRVEVAPEAPFFAAPWGLLPLIPFALLPTEAGRAVVMLGGLLLFAFSAYRLGAKPITMMFFLISPPVIHNILNANIEWLPVLGFVLPPSIGLFFVLIKQQTGFAVAIFWLFEAWRKGGWREVVRVFSPVTIAFLLSFIIYGFWPLSMFGVLKYGGNINSSLWPLSIPAGLVLLVTSIQKHKIEYAMPASPCLSPYLLFHAWSGALISLVKKPLQLITAITGLWIVVAIRYFNIF
jgi:hypothetical protein